MLRDRFQELHPNITVEFQGVPAEEMDARLTTQIAGGNPPDSVFVDMSSVVDYASRNALVDLEPYIAKSVAVKRDDYIGAFLDSVLWEDKMYGLPYDGETTGLFYRKDLFEAAGIAEPPTTWEELEAAAQALTTEEPVRLHHVRAGGGLLLVPVPLAERRRAALGGRHRRSSSTATPARKRRSSTSGWRSTRRPTSSTPTPTTAASPSPPARSPCTSPEPGSPR